MRLAEPLCKLSARITHASQLGRMVRRALKVAGTPPYGPVFLLPMDVLDQKVDEADIFPFTQVLPPGCCDREVARNIARQLVSAKSPLLIAGDGVAEADAGHALSEIANYLGIPVWGAEYNEPVLSFADDMFMGLIGHTFGRNTRKITQEADVVIAVGTPVFPELFPSTDPYFAKGALLIQIDRDPWEIAKNFPAVGVQADPMATLAVLLEEARALRPDEEELSRRRQSVVGARNKLLAEAEAALKAVPDLTDGLAPGTMMQILAEEVPQSGLIYDESITATPALLHYLRPAPGSYYLARGGCIGVGWPGAMGAAVAKPDRIVVAPSGDGSALFALQTLWTAANHRLKVVFIVCNNGAYRILKINLLNYYRDTGQLQLALVDVIVNGSVEKEMHELFGS